MPKSPVLVLKATCTDPEYFHCDLQRHALASGKVVQGELDGGRGLHPVMLPLEHGQEHVVHALHADVPHLLDHLLQHKLLRRHRYHAQPATAREEDR